MHPHTLYHIKIVDKEFSLDFNIRKTYLQESKYFQNLLKQNPDQSFFTFSNQDFDENIYIYIIFF